VKNNIAGIILSGGKGSRFGGVEKAFITVEGDALVDRKVEDLGSFCQDLIVVANKQNLYNSEKYKVVADIVPGKGPLMGLLSGLKASAYTKNFVTAVDMPFFDHALFQYLYDLSEKYDVVVPKIKEHMEPMFAFYSRNCIEAIAAALERGNRKVTSFYDEVKVKYVMEEELHKHDLEQKVFFNINDQNDITKLSKLLKK
jgi:molybdenum cofactor guanylyltransferase